MMTREQLGHIRAGAKRALYTRLTGTIEGAPEGAFRRHVLVCGGTGCESCRSAALHAALQQAVVAQGLAESVKVVKTGCFGFCEKGPIVKIMPDKSFYVRVRVEDADEIVREHVGKGQPVERLLYKEDDGSVARGEEIRFYAKQQRIVLRNCGLINPEDITEYLATDGYCALERVLTEMKPEQVIEELKVAGLRGRGGAGYPTWLKWQSARQAKSSRKYVVCNADEGDPGAYMDRSVLEGDPHAVLEAMVICAKTIGAQQGYIYVRAEYGLAIERLRIALEQAYAHGLLGERILGTNTTFHVAVRLGAGAFVCGEETALL
ncbi:MAG: NAD(P)H-dependent oxidoreductase subunit E, partial [bacterium]|nr:NAD(P)H-dependent oxidoreductase subunit E [bacterium]